MFLLAFLALRWPFLAFRWPFLASASHLPSTAVDMMRLLNCFGVSLCILYWTWFGQFDSVFSPVVMFGHALAAAVSVITFVFSA